MKIGKLQGVGIAALSRFAQSDLADQLKLRKPVEKILYRGSKAGFQLAGAAARAFGPAKSTSGKQRLPGTASSG